MGSKRFYEYAQNLLGGVKKEVGNNTTQGQKGIYYNYTKINYVVLIVLYYNYNSCIILLYIVILLY